MMKNTIELTKENNIRNGAEMKSAPATKKSLKGVIALVVVAAIALGMFMFGAGAANNAYFGDVDHDGTVSPADARLILRKNVGVEDLCDELANLLADMDRDGEITVADARLALRVSVGLTPLSWYPSGNYVNPSTGGDDEIETTTGPEEEHTLPTAPDDFEYSTENLPTDERGHVIHTIPAEYISEDYSRTGEPHTVCPKDGIHCIYCGLPKGNGTNGTCVHIYMDCYCDYCGQFLPAGTCHYCPGHQS